MNLKTNRLRVERDSLLHEHANTCENGTFALGNVLGAQIEVKIERFVMVCIQMFLPPPSPVAFAATNCVCARVCEPVCVVLLTKETTKQPRQKVKRWKTINKNTPIVLFSVQCALRKRGNEGEREREMKTESISARMQCTHTHTYTLTCPFSHASDRTSCTNLNVCDSHIE